MGKVIISWWVIQKRTVLEGVAIYQATHSFVTIANGIVI